MSHRATTWAWRQDVGGMQRLVLLALADSHNGRTGKCCPSLADVARRCGIARVTAQRAVAALVRAELVERLGRDQRPDGTLGVQHYRLPVDNAVDQVAESDVDQVAESALESRFKRAEVARKARAEPGREPGTESRTRDCVRCHGSGKLWNATGGFWIRCSCEDDT